MRLNRPFEVKFEVKRACQKETVGLLHFTEITKYVII